MSELLGLISITPLSLALPLPLLGKVARRRVVNTYFIFSLVVTASITVGTVVVRNAGSEPLMYFFGGWGPWVGIPYYSDMLSAVISVFTGLVVLLVGIYSVWYCRHFENYAVMYSLILILASGYLGFLNSGDFFHNYVMIEVVGIATYSLVAFYSFRMKALASSARYALLAGSIAVLYFLAVALLYHEVGVVSYPAVKEVLKHLTELTNPFKLVFFLVVSFWLAFLVSALFPNHFWLPDAHSEAPTPASALLSGLSVNLGVYLYLRVNEILKVADPLEPYLSLVSKLTYFMALISIAYGAFMMSFEDDVKRILAYSTIMNVGFIFAGASLLTPEGITAGLYHLINHSLGKALAFMAVGVYVRRFRTRNIRALEGTGHYYPLAMFSLVASLFHLIGIPPFGGFFSKLYLFQAFTASREILGVAVLLVATAMSTYAYLRIVEHLWHVPYPRMKFEREGLSPYVAFSLITLVTVIILTGILSSPLSNVLREVSSTFSLTTP